MGHQHNKFILQRSMGHFIIVSLFFTLFLAEGIQSVQLTNEGNTAKGNLMLCLT